MGICQRGNGDVDGYVDGYADGDIDGDVDGDVGGDDASVGYMSRGGRLTSLDASLARCFAF